MLLMGWDRLSRLLTIAELKMMEPKYQANGNGMGMAGNGNGDGNGMAMETEWEDWRQGECLLPQLVGKFYDQQQWCDVRFCLADGSVVAAHKLVLAITSSVFEGMFFGPLADKNLSQASYKIPTNF